jgi:hypothetical protein
MFRLPRGRLFRARGTLTGHHGVMRRSVTLLVALAVSLLASGCSKALGSPAAPAASPAPPTTTSSPDATTTSAAAGTPCSQVYNAIRCQTMTDWVAAQLSTTREQIASLDVIPQPTPQLNTYSGGPPVDVSVTLRDGSVHRMNLNCGGIRGVQCADDPRLETWTVMDPGGYYDGTDAELRGGRPSIAPDALAEAMPLRIARLDIPVDHVGLYEVPVGQARLPNGILTAADFALVESWPTGVSIVDGGVGLDIRSLDEGGKPIRNIYEHGWHPGSERVEAVLVFTVVHFDPGATLGIKDIVVQ